MCSICLSQSTDLNLIDNLWQDLKFAFYKQSPSNPKEHIRIQMCKAYIVYPRRFAAIIVASGGFTKYSPRGVILCLEQINQINVLKLGHNQITKSFKLITMVEITTHH